MGTRSTAPISSACGATLRRCEPALQPGGGPLRLGAHRDIVNSRPVLRRGLEDVSPSRSSSSSGGGSRSPSWLPWPSGALVTKLGRASVSSPTTGSWARLTATAEKPRPRAAHRSHRHTRTAPSRSAGEARYDRARSLAIGIRPGSFALEIAQETGGASRVLGAGHRRSGASRPLASTEGVFTETAGGVTMANLKRPSPTRA